MRRKKIRSGVRIRFNQWFLKNKYAYRLYTASLPCAKGGGPPIGGGGIVKVRCQLKTAYFRTFTIPKEALIKSKCSME